MSAMQKIFGIFQPQQAPVPGQHPVNQPPAPQPNNTPQNNLQTPPNVPADPNNPTVPVNGSANPPAAASPLDQFKTVWEPTPAAKPDPNAPTPPDPQKIMQAATQVDFTKVIKPEQLQAIAKGGEEAVQAFAQSIQSVAGAIYGQSMVATTKIVENAVATAEQRFNERLPQAVSRTSSRELLSQENPAFQNPAVAPLVEMVHSQLAQKYPNASAAELAKLSKEYMAAAASVFNPAKPNQSQAAGPVDENWSDYLGI